MARDYADARFGVNKILNFPVSSAINGTVGATELYRKTMMEAGTLKDWNIRAAVGGTEASVRTVLIGVSTAGTGTTANCGTQTLGTLANGNIVDAALTETTFDVGDDIVISHLGTGAGVYTIEPHVMYTERFVNA